MDIQQQRWSHQSPFCSKIDLYHGFCEGRTNHQSKDEVPTAQKPTKKRPPSQFSPLGQKASEAAPTPSRSLPPTQQNNSSAAPRDVPRQAPSAYSVFIQPTPLSSSKPLSRPNGVEYLLNPTARDTPSAGGRQHDGNGTDSPWTAPIAALSRPATPPQTALRKRPSGDISLPSITTSLMNQYPHPSSRSTTPRSSTSCRPYLITNGPPNATIETRQPLALLPRDQASALTGSTGEPQSHLPAPFTSSDPASTSPQLAFDKEAFHVPSQYQILTFETEQGSIQVPLDVQAASRGANEKRKRNATASHRFRQRRKKKEQEISLKISGLEAQLREMTEEKECYQRERDFLQDVVLQNRIPIPPRPLSPRRRRHALLGGPQVPDTEMSAQARERNTLRRTNTYLPQEQPPHTVAAHVPF
ncbi:MAG: hypothetical protein LQ352_000123 [Teloschistes flavicans]|nr:MAG: hypothetical protein LQ352_000123 [Teloschistes flavicans]